MTTECRSGYVVSGRLTLNIRLKTFMALDLRSADKILTNANKNVFLKGFEMSCVEKITI